MCGGAAGVVGGVVFKFVFRNSTNLTATLRLLWFFLFLSLQAGGEAASAVESTTGR